MHKTEFNNINLALQRHDLASLIRSTLGFSAEISAFTSGAALAVQLSAVGTNFFLVAARLGTRGRSVARRCGVEDTGTR